MSWQPQPEPLRQLAQFLAESLQGLDMARRRNAEQMLKQAETSPDFTNYLALLMSTAEVPQAVALNPSEYHVARSAAAIMMKNRVKTSYKATPEDSRAYLRASVIQALQDSNLQIRSYAGSVITELVKQGGLLAWPQLLSELTSLVENKSGSVLPQTQEGAMNALLKICEDNRRALFKDYQGEQPVHFLFQSLMTFTQSPLEKVRADALAAINCWLPDYPATISQYADKLLPSLFERASDPSTTVRKYVCRAFTHLAESMSEKILPHIAGLVDFTIAQQAQTEDSDLALDAAEFWLTLGEDEGCVGALGPYLDKIVPCLLASMVYSEEDIIRLEGERDDAEEEDRQEDLKPTFAASKGGRNAAATGDDANGKSNGSAKFTELAQDDDLSEGEIEEFDDDDDIEGGDPEEQWNLRKCSAASLDTLSSHFHTEIFQYTLPYLLQHLKDPEWPQREAAVLALGAIADGCMDSVQPHLPELTPFLLTVLADPEPVVRKISCWTLGRYSGWAAHLTGSGQQQFFEPIMDGILQRMLDRNKKVQEAAASAFATLEEKAEGQLTQYAPIIIRQFVKCFSQYKDKNMLILYDCIQTLAEHVGPRLQDPEIVNLLMEALIKRWQKLSDESREMFGLFECLCSVATALGELFAPFSEPIFTRCIRVIHGNLEDTVRASNNPAMDTPDHDFLVTSLDLISALIQSLPPTTSNELVKDSQPNLFSLMTYCMKHDSNEVRQSAYALLGDCAIYIFPQMQPNLPTIMEILIAQLDVSKINLDVDDAAYAVVNNACWSLGETAMREKAGMAPYVDRVLQQIGAIIFAKNTPDSLYENAAIALGRLGTGCADQLAPHLAQIAPEFMHAMKKVMWTDEKGHALLGFNYVIMRNPQAMEAVLGDYFNEIATAPSAFFGGAEGEERRESCKQIIAQYQSLIPNFDAFLQQTLGPTVAVQLKTNLRL